jgi:hypothetical protein
MRLHLSKVIPISYKNHSFLCDLNTEEKKDTKKTDHFKIQYSINEFMSQKRIFWGPQY